MGTLTILSAITILQFLNSFKTFHSVPKEYQRQQMSLNLTVSIFSYFSILCRSCSARLFLKIFKDLCGTVAGFNENLDDHLTEKLDKLHINTNIVFLLAKINLISIKKNCYRKKSNIESLVQTESEIKTFLTIIN